MVLTAHFNAAFATDLVVGNAGESRVEQNLILADKSFAEKRRKVRRAAFPLVLLVPGIMGSKLIDRSSKEILWGKLSRNRPDGPNLSLRFDDVDAEVLDEFNAWLIAVDVYGGGQKRLADLFPDMPDNLKTFPYDWRQDNRFSADRLHEWLCNNRDDIAGRHLVIVAHSMGGLITKYWMKNRRNTSCSNGQLEPKPSSLKVVFVGVPFYGAPKSIAAFSEGFDLLGTNPGSLFGYWDRSHLGKFVNNYGYTFKSAYQLLPVYNDSCIPELKRQRARDNLRPFLKRMLLGGEEKTSDDIFSSDFWKYMKWPQFRDSHFNEDKFYGGELQGYLDAAVNFHCELAGYEFPDDVKVTYFYNRSIKTPVSYKIAQSTGSVFSAQPRFSSDDADGDGTVPGAIADGTLDDAMADNKRSVDPSVEHMEMFAARELWSYILDIYRDAEIQANRQAVENEVDEARLIKAYVDAKALPAYPLGITPTGEATSLYDNIADAVLKSETSDQQAILNLARLETDPSVRTSIYSYLSRQETDNPFVQFYASKDFAHQQFENRMWLNAIGTTEMLTKSPTWQTQILTQRPELAKKIINIEGWANIELGDYQKAKDVLKVGVDLGSENAGRGLTEIDTRMRMQGLGG